MGRGRILWSCIALVCSWLSRLWAFGAKAFHLTEHSDTLPASFLQSSFASEHWASLPWVQCWSLLCCSHFRRKAEWTEPSCRTGSQKGSCWWEHLLSMNETMNFLTNLFLSLFLFSRWQLSSSLHITAHRKETTSLGSEMLTLCTKSLSPAGVTYRPSHLFAAQIS